MAKGDDPHANLLHMQYGMINETIYPNGVLPHEIKEMKKQMAREMGQTTDYMWLRGRTRNKRGEYKTIE